MGSGIKKAVQQSVSRRRKFQEREVNVLRSDARIELKFFFNSIRSLATVMFSLSWPSANLRDQNRMRIRRSRRLIIESQIPLRIVYVVLDLLWVIRCLVVPCPIRCPALQRVRNWLLHDKIAQPAERHT